MNREFLTLLFYNASCDVNTICSEDLRLSTLYERIPKTTALVENVAERLVSLGIDPADEVIAYLEDLGEAREMQGFINGFRLGMMARDECVQVGHKGGEGDRCLTR